MQIIDTHCDALYKLQMAGRTGRRQLNYRTAEEIETNVKRLQIGGVWLQFFALFIDYRVPQHEKWNWLLEQIDLFQTEVIGKNDEIKHIKRWTQLHDLQAGDIGAVLALEGVDAIGNDLNKLHYLYEAGVLSVGLTWNNANLAADGVDENRHGGLTAFGTDIIRMNNHYRILTDVSHLSEKSFWDVLEIADYVYASHSNVRSICQHPRNLTDIQLHALFAKGGLVNVTFYPPFINRLYEKKSTATNHLLQHITYLYALGGKNNIGFGSDFDGIDQYVDNLQDAGQYPSLINELLHRFPYETVERFAKGNFIRFISPLGVDQ